MREEYLNLLKVIKPKEENKEKKPQDNNEPIWRNSEYLSLRF